MAKTAKVKAKVAKKTKEVVKVDSVTRQTIARLIADSNQMTIVDATNVVEEIIGTITGTLAKGEEVLVTGFGKFVILDKKARVGRNPQTGKDVTIPAHRVLKFRPSDILKDSINK